MNQETIYLDFAATTPVDERVVQAMLPFFTEIFGNPSSIHRYGQKAEAAVESAREDLARLIHANPEEIIFTGCGSESDNMAIRGVAAHQRFFKGKKHLLISPVEHPAILQTARDLAKRENFELEFLPINEYGQVDPDDVKKLIRPETAMVSVMYANNEIGSINPIAQIGLLCEENQIPFHTDAVQAAAHIPIDVLHDHIGLLSLGAHKFYGPKGVGAIFLRNGISVLPAITGGSQEFGLRAGTHNVPLIMGFVEAYKLSIEEMYARNLRFIELRDYLINAVLGTIPESKLTGHPTLRLPNHASFVFRGVDGNMLIMFLDQAGFACSSGSACKSGNPKPSEVLTALGFSDNWSMGSLRVTLGKSTTKSQIDSFLDVLPKIIKQSRKYSSE